MTDAPQETAAHEAGSAPTSELLHAVSEALEAHDKDKVRNLLSDVQGPDLADLIELLESGSSASPSSRRWGRTSTSRC